MTSFVLLYNEKTNEIMPTYNPLVCELRFLIIQLMYILGWLDQAASYGDLVICIKCLDLVDNVSTSLRRLCEVEYSIREQVHNKGF